ncbi:aminotransferase DegT [Candidatus Roizmanbacteria bacterium CG10_big_fil_rev_8_21_14_0_10_39_6]|uniref:Aminotransferase DegT n=1 Tax=Candidatus Roizmanbacteria bacterium CG10_big_fil_rev_8_21_14_0_10_39_6 TaxID=1974853 RepID=A0A2M8KSL5_9BACT|nr:MAG: aminotransferase DegT [Candidatus Roizmanbacteria bacterium CG10_big_fil_rev_8_21_14_0_10_39_6]
MIDKNTPIQLSKPIIGDEEIKNVIAVLKSGMLAQGAVTKEFEERFANLCGTKYAVAVSNGTAAIHCALYALGVDEQDEVITTPFTFVATANPILMQRARVVFVDISESDYCINPQEVKKKITKKTQAIIPVDLFGQVYDSETINNIAKEHNIKVLEDACQAVGASRNGIMAGNIADISVFSLYATKNITTGEGGMITTNNEEYARKCKLFRHHGQDETLRYEYIDMGYNYRTTDICSAIGLAQLDRLESINTKRMALSKIYYEKLRDVIGISLPQISSGNIHVFHQFSVRLEDDFSGTRESLISYLEENNIKTGIYYPKPLHLHPHFRKFGFKEGDFPVSEKIATQILSLPIHPSLTEEQVNFVSDKIIEYAKK